MENPEKLVTQDTQDTGQINVREYRRGNQNGESRETTGNICYTRHRTNKRQRIPKGQSKMDNPEKLATQDTQDTGQINVREYRRGNQKMDNSEKLATQDTQYDEKHNTKYV